MSSAEFTGSLERFTIVGLGMLGGSIAKDLREKMPNAEISAIDPNEDSVGQAMAEGVVNRAETYEGIGRAACFVIITSPLETVAPIARELSSAISDDGKISKDGKWVVMDTASVKTDITSTFESLTDERVEFISTHPMAGTEFAGYPHSRKHLFRAKPWIVCRHDQNTEESIRMAEDLIHILGGRAREIDAEKHDQQAAVVSHSVIMLSNLFFDFVASRYPEALEVAGDGFNSTTRLASGNPRLHEEILKLNRHVTGEVLGEFKDYLGSVVGSNLALPEGFFERNKKKRDQWLHRLH